MKRKIILAFVWLAALAASLTAGIPPITLIAVTVYDFTGDTDLVGFGRKVTTLVTADLTTETNLLLLERAELDKALSELAFGSSGMVSSDAAARIGQITGAKVLVAGQVIKTGEHHLVVVANIIGTETGRLFASKVEGDADGLMDLTSELSRQIAKTVTDQATNLVRAPEELHADRVERILPLLAE